MDSTLLVLQVFVHHHMFLLQDTQLTSSNVRIVNFPHYFFNFPSQPDFHIAFSLSLEFDLVAGLHLQDLLVGILLRLPQHLFYSSYLVKSICVLSWTMRVAQVVSKPHLFITFLLPDFHLLLMQLEFPVLNIQSKQFAFLKCDLNLFACSCLRHPYLSNSCWIFSTRCSIDFSNSSVFF